MRNGITRFFGRLLRRGAAPEGELRSVGGSLLDLFGEGSTSGQPVTQGTALGLPVVAACVRLLSDMVSGLPLVLYRKDARGDLPCPSHPAQHTVNYPCSLHTAFGLRQLVMTGALLGGNGYARVHRDALGRPEELEWLRPQSVRVERLRGTRHLSYRIEGQPAVLGGRDILHVRSLSTDGVRGLSPISLLRESIGTALALRERAARLLDKSAQFNGVVKMPPEATPEQVAQMREFWTRRHQGAGTEGVVPILQGADFQAIGGMSAVDAEFLENRRFEIQEIARLYGVPGFLVGDTTASTTWGSGIAQQNLGFLLYSLNPWLINFEHALNSTLLTREECLAGYHFEFDREELSVGWLPEQSAFVSTMRSSGVFSVNDARDWLGYRRIDAPGMDDYQIVPVGGVPARAGADNPEGAPQISD